MKSRDDGWSTTDLGGARRDEGAWRASGQIGHGGEEGARSNGRADGSTG